MQLSRRVACHVVIFSHSIGYVPRRTNFVYVFFQCHLFTNSGFVNTIYKQFINSLINLFTKEILAILVNTIYKLFINSLRNMFTNGILAILVNTFYKPFINSLRKVFTKGMLAILVNTFYKLFINSLRKVFTKENLAIMVNKVDEFIIKFINSMGSQSFREKNAKLPCPPTSHFGCAGG
jgi:hypothetical protein